MKVTADRALPWWTWVLPLLICHLGTRVSLFFQAGGPEALIYWPVALGLGMALWWGPRVLIGVFLNAMLSAQLWAPLPLVQVVVSGLPETAAVASGWFLYGRVFRGDNRLPNLRNLLAFLLIGLIVVSGIVSFGITGFEKLAGFVGLSGVTRLGTIVWLGDNLDLLLVTVPLLVFLTPWLEKKGWTQTISGNHQGLHDTGFSQTYPRFERAILLTCLIACGIFLSFEQYWLLFGILLLWVTVRYGFFTAILASGVVQILVHYVPLLAAQISNHPQPVDKAASFNVYFGLVVCGYVSLIVGRVVSDLVAEIQQRKEAEEALRMNEQRLRVMIEKSSEAITVVDPDGRRTFVSANSAILLGYSLEELFERDVLQDIHPEDREQAVKTLRDVVRQPGKSVVARLRGLRKDGTHVWVEATATNLMGEPAIGGVVINTRDISAQVQYERSLQESANNLEDALRVARMAYWVFDVASGFFTFNAQFYVQLGTTAQEAGGYRMRAEDFFTRYVVQAYARYFHEALKRAIAGEILNFQDQVEGQMQRPDGARIWVSTWYWPEKDTSGKVVRLFGVIQDITEAKRRETIQAARLRLVQYAEGHSLHDLLQATLDELGELTASPIGFYHFVEPDQKTLTLQAWSSRTTREYCSANPSVRHYALGLAGVWADSARERRAIIHNDYASLPNKRGLPEGHAALTRELVVPVLRGEHIVAILGVGNKPVDYIQDDVSLVSDFADMAWEIAERKREFELSQTSQTRLKAVFDLSGIALAVLDPNGKWLQVNQCWERMMGYSEQELCAMTSLMVTHPDDIENSKEKVAALKEGKIPSYRIEKRYLTKEGGIVWVDLSVTPLMDENGQITALLAAGADITERKQAEEKLKRHSQELALLAEASRELGKSLDPREIYAVLNQYLSRSMPNDFLFVSSFDPADQLIRCVAVWEGPNELDTNDFPPILLEPEGKGTQSLVIRSGEPLVLNDYQAYVRTAQTKYYVSETGEISDQINEDAEVIRSALVVPLKLEEQVVGVIQLMSVLLGGYSEDHLRLLESLSLHVSSAMVNAGLFKRVQAELDERRRTEVALRQSEKQFRQLVDTSPLVIMVFQDGKYVFVNPAGVKKLGYPQDELVGEVIFKVIHPEDHESVLNRMKALEMGAENEPIVMRIVKKNGETYLSESLSVPIEYNERPAGLIISRDVTEERRAEAQLRASLDEKNALIKEVHHRVKNNMQVMISLLSLQGGQAKELRTRDMFLDSENRIRSMALVHEELYRSIDLSSINFGAYLQRLVGDLHSAYDYAGLVRLKVNVQPVSLPIEAAVTCGLLVNELVTNAFKHAFPNGRRGWITVSFQQEQDSLVLRVGDDGVGIPAAIQLEKTDSLGIKLIMLLASQLEGTLDLERSPGTRFTLRFPASGKEMLPS